jgi:CO/xanthine dehydrogenase FAD-binding subunit
VPVKLPYVEYEAPATVAEAVHLLAEHEDEASVLAGGQSLVPLLALRLARPAVLIDINGLGELSEVSVADGWTAIGALTREYVAEDSALVAGSVPLLAAALPLIGHEAIRSRGTIGGSLAHGDPAAELPAVARALDAEFVVRSLPGDRVVQAADWFEGYLATARRPDEILVGVRFPTAGPGTGVADVPVRAADAEDLLAGGAPSPELFEEAARRATAGLDPPADLHGSSEYRKKIAATLVRRGLQAALDNAHERQ